jgi:DNA-binding Lrp family transcriptional regulator
MDSLDEVRKALAQFPKGASWNNIADKIGASKTTVYEALNKLREKGEVVNINRSWFLKSAMEATIEVPKTDGGLENMWNLMSQIQDLGTQGYYYDCSKRIVMLSEMDEKLKAELVKAVKYSSRRTGLTYSSLQTKQVCNDDDMESLDLRRRAAYPAGNLTSEEMELLIGKLGKVLREISKSVEQ